jgi:hypothetical protein
VRVTTPPSPVNTYGFLEAASELVVTERAERGTVARIGGVQGVHWARQEMPRRFGPPVAPNLRTQLGRLRDQIDTGRLAEEDTIAA